MRQQRRRARKVGHENHERWLITYSDLITLLLIFFVIMYAFSSVNVSKFQTLSQSLASALQHSNPVDLNTGNQILNMGGSTNPLNTVGKAPIENKDAQNLDDLYTVLANYVKTHNLTDKVSLENQQRGVQITLKDVVLFDTGDAAIKPQADALLEGLIPFLQKVPNQIVIEGYTDNQPISTSIYPSNWELSAARAIGVVHFLALHGVNPVRLSGTGYGQYHAVASNSTAAGRQQNRRVTIVVLRDNVQVGSSSAQPKN